MGEFAGFKDVSIYVHGIESVGKKFKENAQDVAGKGEVIVHEKDGMKKYSIADGEGGFERSFDSFTELKQSKQEYSRDGRLHFVYVTENENEHRQETSDDLTQRLTEMGLMNDETNIDMFAHSYGGRRSLQFAMDHPEHVESITTIGTPYHTNFLREKAENHENIAGWLDRDVTDNSNYLDFNEENQRVDDNVQHSNAYTDMASVNMADTIDDLKEANPETYQNLRK